MAMGTDTWRTKLGITFLILLMSPVSVFAFAGDYVGHGLSFGEASAPPSVFLVCSIDIWALGLVARTVFLEPQIPSGSASGFDSPAPERDLSSAPVGD